MLEGYAVDGLEDRVGSRRCDRSCEAEGRESCTRTRPCTNGVIESDKAAQQEKEAEVLGEVNGGPGVALGVP